LGCKAHVLIPREQRQKLNFHSHEAIFLGYSEEAKAYCLMNIQTKKLIIFKDVIFHEILVKITQRLVLQEDNETKILIYPTLFKLPLTPKGPRSFIAKKTFKTAISITKSKKI